MTTSDLEPAWTDLKSEIARKAMEKAERLIVQSRESALSDRELWIALDAILDTIQGLAPVDVFDTLYAIRNEIVI